MKGLILLLATLCASYTFADVAVVREFQPTLATRPKCSSAPQRRRPYRKSLAPR